MSNQIEAKEIQKYAGKSLPTLTRLAVLHFHAFVRRRDSEGDYFKCISCGQYKSADQCQASHYMSAGHYSATRFDPDNVHAACTKCNLHLHGNLLEYRMRLLDKIGAERVAAVEIKAKFGVMKIEKMNLIDIIIRYKCKKS